MTRAAPGLDDVDMDETHIIIGGGTYGCFAALMLAELVGGENVVIVEQEPDLMQRASYNNQARVHNGYHYPRSLLTALRSRLNALRFAAEFPEAIASDFEQYYAISRRRSNVTAGQFEQFCRRIGAELKPARPEIRKLFDQDLVEAVYWTREYAFDADKLRECLKSRIADEGIRVLTRKEALKIAVEPAGGELRFRLEVHDLGTDQTEILRCKYLYNCTYARLNRILAASGLQTIRLTHEATEIALVELPQRLRGIGITVMCGPFFSVMPFPAQRLATLSHVSYTPHYEWKDDPREGGYAAHAPAFPLRTRFDRMRRDAARYVPALRDCVYVRSLWEVKTILPQSDANDSRPILLKREPSAPNLVSLLGGKIDNIFDLDEMLPRRERIGVAAGPPGLGRVG